MTKDQYLQFVSQEQRRCDNAFFDRQIIQIPWQQIIYETLEEDRWEHEQLYKFNKSQRGYWGNIEQQQGCLNTYRDKNVMIVNYLVWYGKIYLPSFRCDLNRLPQLDSCSMHEALSHGYLTMIAGNLQFYAANIIEQAGSKQRAWIDKKLCADYDFRNQIGIGIWKNKIRGI